MNLMHYIRFVNDKIHVLLYGEHKEDVYINSRLAKHINAVYDEDGDERKKWTHIFIASDPLWLNLQDIDVEMNGKFLGNVKKTIVGARKRLVAMTMVALYDIPLIPAYVEYNSRLGVEHFYIYINDSITNVQLPELEHVSYIEWKYPYYNENKIHCAQMMAITDFLYFAKHISDYILYTDVDEFIESTRIDLSNNKICYVFLNKFVQLNNVVPFLESIDPIIKKNFTEDSEIFEYKCRSKCIVSSSISNMNIHYMYDPPSDSENTEIVGNFFHVRNFHNRRHVSV